MVRSVAVSALVAACLGFWLVVPGCSDALAEARALETQGDLGGALEIYQTLLEEDPNDVEALSGAAVCLLMLGRYDEALVFQESLVALDPSDWQTRIELGFNYLNHQERPVDAVRVFEEAVYLEHSAKHLTFLAQARNKAGDYQGSEETLREAIAVDPAYAHSYSVLVRLLQGQGRSEEAEQLVQEAALHGVEVADSH